MELERQLLPSPISTRLYDTYPETVKVGREGKDDGDGQTQGLSNQETGPQDEPDSTHRAENGAEEEGRGEKQSSGREEGRCTEIRFKQSWRERTQAEQIR
jgi:hypothetical protein